MRHLTASGPICHRMVVVTHLQGLFLLRLYKLRLMRKQPCAGVAVPYRVLTSLGILGRPHYALSLASFPVEGRAGLCLLSGAGHRRFLDDLSVSTYQVR